MLKDKRFWAGCAISVALMALLTRGLDWRQLGAAWAQARWGWIAPALLLYIASYWSRARRITLILAPLKTVSTGRALPPLLIGFMVNNLLPARLGELVFAYLLGQREDLASSSALAAVLLSRILDGFSILLFFLAGLFFFLNTQDHALLSKLKLVGYSGAGVFGLALAGFACLVAWRGPTLKFLELCLGVLPRRWSAKGLQLVESFVGGLGILSQPGPLFRVFAENLLPWTLELGVYACVARAFGLGLGLAQCSLVMGMCNLAMLLPSVPGGLGLFEAGGLFVAGLWGPAGSAGATRDPAVLGFLLVTHMVILVPVNLGGAYCLWNEGISMSGTLKALGTAKR
jgi:uncharacterized protein (TIRG00374 family)